MMEHLITYRKPIFAKGMNLVVQLEFTPGEQQIIKTNNMETVVIVANDPTTVTMEDKDGKKYKVPKDNNIYFSEFYGRRTSWHADSTLEAKEFHAKLFEGFKRFKEFLANNNEPGQATGGDFEFKPPAAFSTSMVPDYMWAQHAYILAESGGGKTQLLQTIIAQQLSKPNAPGLVVIDSQNQMIPLIKERFPDALIIDPFNNPPGFDLFSPGLFDAETDVAPIIDTFLYLFNAGQEPMTGRQQTAFTYAIALMLIGYPRAFGENATIEDLEDYLTGDKKGLELTERAHQAVSAMPDHLTKHYFTQYGRFADSHSQILQRLANICGQFAPLRPLFKKQTDTLNLKDRLANGGIILVNTNRHALGPHASSFFGRFFFKLLDREIGDRNDQSHPLIFMVDEVHEYFEPTVIVPFLDLARKRNISCVFAHQRLAQLAHQETLRDALTGVGTLFATNVNKNDAREVAGLFHVEPEQVSSWRPEYVEGGRRPHYADFGLIFKGKIAQTVRVEFGQLEKLPIKKAKQEQRKERAEEQSSQEAPRQEAPRQEAPRQEAPKGDTSPPKEDAYDSRYDLEWEMPLSPSKARRGTVLTIKRLPNGRSGTHPIPPGTKDGYRFCMRKESMIRRPDGTIGNLWIELRIADYNNDAKEDF